MADAPRRRPSTGLIVAGLVLLFLIWGAWAWSQWGKPGHGVDDSPAARVQPATVPPPGPSAQPAQPDNSGRDATGDGYTGDRTVTREPG